jgi:nucleotide-binding universal stress UspA family protein
VDLSDASRRAVELAIRLSNHAVSTLDVVHAVDVPYISMLARGGMSAKEIDEYVASTEESARTLLDAWIPSAKAMGVELNAVLRRGDPRRIIAHEIAERGADLVVLGSTGHSTMGRLLLGSVAEAVMRTAPCDVLVAR